MTNDLPVTEQENVRSRGIDALSIEETVALINDEDHRVAEAVRLELPHVRRAVEGIVERLRRGGRLIYVGAGTSGRLGVLDASECPPTYGVSPELVQGMIAGGYEACYRAVEASEDDADAGARDIAARQVSANDVIVGIAASGRTPYTIGAVAHARAIGALTEAVTCAPGSAITAAAEIAIAPMVGPEVVAGSTRMKAGTAQKLVLNMLSTTALIKLGYVRGNRMTNMRARNSKLLARAGAPLTHVAWRVYRDVCWQVAGGVLVGVPLVPLLTPYGSALLYGVRPVEPWAIVMSAVLLAVVAVAAASLPARRALTIAPSEALRDDGA